MAIEIVDLPSKKIVIFHSYVAVYQRVIQSPKILGHVGRVTWASYMHHIHRHSRDGAVRGTCFPCGDGMKTSANIRYV